MRIALLGFVAALATLAWAAGVSAAAPVDLFNDGERTESVRAGGVNVHDLKRGALYGASTFPLKLTARPPDALWLGGQTQAGTYRFGVSQHKSLRNAQGKVSVWGSGEVAVETGTGKTGSVAQVLKNLRSTPQISVTAPVSVRVAGYGGQQFDATITGAEPGEHGEAFVPFSGDPRPVRDHMFVLKGEKLRIIVVGVRGKTVVIYEQPSMDRLEKTFPAFTGAAKRLLATLVLGAKT
jgi:hypothetical protein